MNKHGTIYKFHVYHASGKIPLLDEKWNGWVYEIYTQFDDVLIHESDEWFDSKGEASLAAIGYITLLENGEA